MGFDRVDLDHHGRVGATKRLKYPTLAPTSRNRAPGRSDPPQEGAGGLLPGPASEEVRTHDLVAGLYPQRADVRVDLLERPAVLHRCRRPVPTSMVRGAAPAHDGMPARTGDIVDPPHLRRPSPGRASDAGRGSAPDVPTSASISWLVRPRSKIRISLGGCPTIASTVESTPPSPTREGRLEAFIGRKNRRAGTVGVDPKPHHVDITRLLLQTTGFETVATLARRGDDDAVKRAFAHAVDDARGRERDELRCVQRVSLVDDRLVCVDDVVAVTDETLGLRDPASCVVHETRRSKDGVVAHRMAAQTPVDLFGVAPAEDRVHEARLRLIIAVGIAIQNPTPDGMGMACPSNSSSSRSEIQSMTAGASARWSGSLLGMRVHAGVVRPGGRGGDRRVLDERAEQRRDQVRRARWCRS